MDGTRARLEWFKDTHGLLQNRAAQVLREALLSCRAIFDAVEKQALALPEVVAGQRTGFSAWSRSDQFAAVRPLRAAWAAS